MKLLEIEFRSKGFNFSQIKRHGDVAMFAKRKHGGEWYEVVLVQKHAQHTWPNGTVTPEGEHMPSSEQWGTYGWSYTTRDDAERKYASLCNS